MFLDFSGEFIIKESELFDPKNRSSDDENRISW
jgi:hypothetical protein